MNQEKEMTQKSFSVGDYLAPSVKVHEIKTRKVLCASFTQSTEDMDEGSTDYFFN